MSGSMGCGGLGVSGGGGDSVIRISGNNISETVVFADSESIVESINETVTVVVT